MSTLTQTTLGQGDLDVKACYDRMSRHLVAHTCFVYGLPKMLCIWLYLGLHQQWHYTITGEGISTKSYGSTPKNPHQGIGQGSTAAPVVWLLISSLIYKSMQNWATGVQWQDPKRCETTARKVDVYVDDATLWTNGMSTTRATKAKMKTDLIKYHEILNWTGGDLTLYKCFFGIMEWEFKKNGMPQLIDQQHHLEIPMSTQGQKIIKNLRKN